VGKTALVIVSAVKSKIAPVNAEAGINLLLSGPKIKRIKWGIIRPTKPIIPDTDTQTAVTRDAVIKRIILTRFVSIPKEEADLSPNDIIFKSRAKKTDTTSPIETNKKVKKTSDQILEPKLPISQKIIIETCSSATYLIKLIPADKIAATIKPDNIKLVEDILPLEDDRTSTAPRVVTPPINAKKGTE